MTRSDEEQRGSGALGSALPLGLETSRGAPVRGGVTSRRPHPLGTLCL